MAVVIDCVNSLLGEPNAESGGCVIGLSLERLVSRFP